MKKLFTLCFAVLLAGNVLAQANSIKPTKFHYTEKFKHEALQLRV